MFINFQDCHDQSHFINACNVTCLHINHIDKQNARLTFQHTGGTSTLLVVSQKTAHEVARKLEDVG